MTLDEIRDAADMAEKWPGACVLNWSEISMFTLAAWVACNSRQPSGVLTGTFDVESVKSMFEEWWRAEKAKVTR
jgi:hypothetical protein